MKINRRTVLVTGSAIVGSIAISNPALAAAGDKIPIDKLNAIPEGWIEHPLGNPDAKVTLIEYSSPTCPHCASFANSTYPAFKEEYIDTGKVQFILRPFVRNALDAAVFLLAVDSGEYYHDVIETYFRSFDTWTVSDKPRDAMLAVAMQLGFSVESFEKALTNEDTFKVLQAIREQATEEFGVSGTPTFYLNGETISGSMGIDDIRSKIDPLV